MKKVFGPAQRLPNCVPGTLNIRLIGFGHSQWHFAVKEQPKTKAYPNSHDQLQRGAKKSVDHTDCQQHNGPYKQQRTNSENHMLRTQKLGHYLYVKIA
ncbi:MAG: hypothetical protein PSV26_07125 [Polaromonas sp.]|uniref:hypothetical protein n=1 Tax=Polaromonas sp. TaxID=1869339 RepID=UPI0024890373|nr:hypothetical protein [Polaromonas sp.]MDI1237238.1 hypothetical protein [Polaromonas sp.]MDO9260050.1 hypothetical protein [Polaromonas sp.]